MIIEEASFVSPLFRYFHSSLPISHPLTHTKILKSNKIILNAKTFSMLRHSLDAISLVWVLAQCSLRDCLTSTSQYGILLHSFNQVAMCVRVCVYVSSRCYLIMPSSYMTEWNGMGCQKRKSFIQCARWYAAATMKNCWKCTMLYGGIIIHIDEAIKVCCERKVFSRACVCVRAEKS